MPNPEFVIADDFLPPLELVTAPDTLANFIGPKVLAYDLDIEIDPDPAANGLSQDEHLERIHKARQGDEKAMEDLWINAWLIAVNVSKNVKGEVPEQDLAMVSGYL